ncbi:MAG: hypothetical protein ABW321_00440 [Polyangiales bacterium]
MAALALVASAGCVSTRLVDLAAVQLPLPAADPLASWQAQLAALFAQYEQAPVLAPEDQRLQPLYGGLTTLGYFGTDALPRVQDQLIPAEGAARGLPLEAACEVAAVPSEVDAETALATTGVPRFAPVWLPLAIAGGSASDAVRCSDRGVPTGAGADASFCLFGRLALQPHGPRTLVVAAHGLFDSGAQQYMQRLAAVLYRLGHSVFVPDLRDHGDTLRAAPQLATGLGNLEGADLLASVEALQRVCGVHIAHVGVAGVSGGGLAAIRALSLDQGGVLDAGVVALSPLLDVDAAIRDLSETGTCSVARAVELDWVDDVLIGGAAGVAAFGGAALGQALAGRALDADAAWVGLVGLGVGLTGALVVDAFFDGGSQPCVAEHAIGDMVQGVLQVRWRSLQRHADALSPVGQRMAPETVDLPAYLRERVAFSAHRRGLPLQHFDPALLSRELHAALRGRQQARLLVIGARDDPMTRHAALESFAARVRDLPEVYVRELSGGGHGAMWLVQPAVMQAVLERFFRR